MQRFIVTFANRRLALLLVLATLPCGLTGCSHFRLKPSDKYVYVTAKQTFLRDRVAAVSNRTGTAKNGEKLVVLDHARRFIKVRTPSGAIGWIEEKLTAGQDVADKFEALGASHQKDPVVAKATARDEVYLHIAPGRETDRFYLLAENDPLTLLSRATILKPITPGAAPVAALAAKPRAKRGTRPAAAPADDPGAPAPPPMEDWWLVRNSKGQTGWIYARMIDVTAPDTLARYAEGQRIVGAYILAHVDDPASGVLDNGNIVTSIPEYLTVLSPYKAGLPYDFDQVRVFIWNTKKHRYETAFREHNIAGYLPVKIDARVDPYGKAANSQEKLPSFTYRVLAGDQAMPVPDPTTGLIKPGSTFEKTYRLEGNICRRLLPPGMSPPDQAHPNPVAEKKVKPGRSPKAPKAAKAATQPKVAKATKAAKKRKK